MRELVLVWGASRFYHLSRVRIRELVDKAEPPNGSAPGIVVYGGTKESRVCSLFHLGSAKAPVFLL